MSIDAKIQHHENLDVWRLGMMLAKSIYSFTSQLPISERFGLSAQMRSAAVSVPSNIAEGAARGTAREFSRFVSIAQGSLAELHMQLLLARDVYKINPDETILATIVSLRRMLIGLRAALNRRASS